MKLRGLAAITIVAICGGCASSYTPPITTYDEPGTSDLSDTVEYRTLTRADFQATTLPNGGKGIPLHASAALFGAIEVAPEFSWFVTQLKTGSDSTLFEATAHNLRFQAIMDPKTSWWREELDSVSTAYVLEHEQIHFAIFELGARRLNARITEIAASVRAVGRTIDDARRAANARLEEELRASDQDVAMRQGQFERETANGKLRDRQKEWWSRIQAELVSTAWSR
jgi:hypothetical protein